MQAYSLALGILAVWRVTHLLNAEDGPGDILLRIRQLAGSGFWGGLLDCFYCLSLWIAMPFAVVLSRHWLERVLLWLAFSAGAILLERATLHTPWPQYTEGPEVHGELLREKKRESDNAIEPGS
jgi:Protein of unknown function (DUF1360)